MFLLALHPYQDGHIFPQDKQNEQKSHGLSRLEIHGVMVNFMFQFG